MNEQEILNQIRNLQQQLNDIQLNKKNEFHKCKETLESLGFKEHYFMEKNFVSIFSLTRLYLNSHTDNIMILVG